MVFHDVAGSHLQFQSHAAGERRSAANRALLTNVVMAAYSLRAVNRGVTCRGFDVASKFRNPHFHARAR